MVGKRKKREETLKGGSRREGGLGWWENGKTDARERPVAADPVPKQEPKYAVRAQEEPKSVPLQRCAAL